MVPLADTLFFNGATLTFVLEAVNISSPAEALAPFSIWFAPQAVPEVPGALGTGFKVNQVELLQKKMKKVGTMVEKQSKTANMVKMRI